MLFSTNGPASIIAAAASIITGNVCPEPFLNMMIIVIFTLSMVVAAILSISISLELISLLTKMAILAKWCNYGYE